MAGFFSKFEIDALFLFLLIERSTLGFFFFILSASLFNSKSVKNGISSFTLALVLLSCSIVGISLTSFLSVTNFLLIKICS